MEKGRLIEFRQNGERRLAVAERPEGKTNWVVLDERSHAHTIHPRQVTYEVPGQTFQVKQIPQFRQEVEQYIDPSSVEVAWEILVEEGKS